MSSTGYAVTMNGVIDIKTVSPTELGAKVNWLTCIMRIIISNAASDDLIAEAFTEVSTKLGARLIRVNITEENGQ